MRALVRCGGATLIRQVTAACAVAVGLAGCGGGTAEPIFNGRDLTGWSVSEGSSHGRTRSWHVEDGAIVAGQEPQGVGGILLSTERYRDVEVSLEVWPDAGCDSGLLLRSNAQGQGYQVTIDYVDGGAVGSIYGEGLEGVEAEPNPAWVTAWRAGEWNELRARIEGEVPRITVWINGTPITDWTDTANHAAGGAADGFIGLQVHGGDRWARDGRIRFRNIRVRPASM